MALAGSTEAFNGLKNQLKASAAKQAEAQEVEKKKLGLEIEVLERKKKSVPSTSMGRDQLVAKLRADLNDMVAKGIMTTEAAAKWQQKEAMVLHGWGG